MRIEVTARHFRAPRELRNFVEREIRRLKRYYGGVLDCQVVLSRGNGQAMVEIVAHSKGHQFTVIESSPKIDRAVVLAVEKLKSQLKRHKEKLVEK